MTTGVPWWDGAFRAAVEGKRVILCTASVAGGVGLARAIRQFDPTDVLVYAMAPGEVPDDVHVVSTDPPAVDTATDLMDHWQRHMAHPSGEAVAAFDAFDPDGSAVVLRFLAAEPRILAGRPVAAYRPDSWVALEDKTVIDDFFARWSVPHQPSIVVAVDDAPAASAQYDIGHGVVWAADASQGEHSGGDLTKWVRSPADVDNAIEDLRPRCDQVRIMPFVEGIPCSIHGVVLPDGVAVLRPVEMLTLRNEHRFVYFGSSTFWDPPALIRDQMRSMAHQVGEALASEVDFRGAFSLDGVAAPDGFWPTEVNPRVGGGLVAISNADSAPPVMLFELIVAGTPLGCGLSEFERRLLEIADGERSAVMHNLAAPTTTQTLNVKLTGSEWQTVGDNQPFDAEVSASPAGITARLRQSAVRVGSSAATTALAFAEFCDRELGTVSGELVAAPNPFV